MFSARALLLIIKQSSEEHYMELLKHYDVSTVYSTPGEGTATHSLLSVLGLEATEKVVLFTVVSRRKAVTIMQELVYGMGINIPGQGIAMSIPLSSIGSMRGIKYLIGDIKDEDNEVDTMNENKSYPYDLLVVVAERGSSDLVMDAARSAGAGGGTIVHAKGTASVNTAKFFGISIANEKELLFIATRRENKDAIMHAIMERAGADTDAHSVVLSVPVEDVVGLRSVMESGSSGNS